MKIKTLIRCAIVFLMGSCLAIATQTSRPSKVQASGEDVTLPSTYCMRDEYVLYSEHQDDHGYCWNFAATMSATTTIMKATNEYYDFSELWNGIACYNLDDSYTKVGAGGSFSWQYEAIEKSGMMLECDFPYEQSYVTTNGTAADYYNFYNKYSNNDVASTVVNNSETRFSKNNIDEIKNHVYNHGSLYMTIAFRTSFVEGGGAYYLPPNQKNTHSLHAISVIGWDDDYQMEVYLDGEETPTLFKGAWIILNSYTEKSGKDGISFVFYDDTNIGSTLEGYRYETNTEKDLYFYDKIDAGYAYPTNVIGKYYGDFTAETGTTKQKNIFYDDVNLGYSYTISDGASIESVDVYLENRNVTDKFEVRVDETNKTFSIAGDNADYGQYKVLVTYGNGEKSGTYLNNFFVTHGLFGEEIEVNYTDKTFAFSPGRNLEYYSITSPQKNHVIYTDQLSGSISFLATQQSVYSEKNMSIPTISYEIQDGKSCTQTYTITSNTGYLLNYNFHFEYYDDTSLQTVYVYYDLGGGTNHEKNYARELANENTDLVLYAPTREGYTFKGWYLDYGHGSAEIPKVGDKYYVSWNKIAHLGEAPAMSALSAYKKYYKNSNVLFVYAQWEEVDYHNVHLKIIGEGTTQIAKDVSVDGSEALNYIFKPNVGWCFSGIKINGEALSVEQMHHVISNGLRVDKVNEDTTIEVAFVQGTYIILNYGENVKNAYLTKTYQGETVKFYNGDFVPAEIIEAPAQNRIDLIVEIFDDHDGKTYVLNNAASYIPQSKGVFLKELQIFKSSKAKTINVDTVTAKDIKDVTVKYKVGGHISDHYISSDIDARQGNQFSAVYPAGQVVYLFLKKPANTAEYTYTFVGAPWKGGITREGFTNLRVGKIEIEGVQLAGLPYFSYVSDKQFVALGNDWYRIGVYVNVDKPDLGEIQAKREKTLYSVVWKNWDGTNIYEEECAYGATPVYFNEDDEGNNLLPTKPSDEQYSYNFIGWDVELAPITKNMTYTAVFEAVERRYNVTVQPTENGTITSSSENTTITYTDTITYTFTPAEGYRVKDVVVNGVSVGAVRSYTLANASCDQDLAITFEKIVYTVTIDCGGNGATDVAETTQVEYGSDLTIRITPKANYVIGYALVNGERVEIVNQQLSIENITQNVEVVVVFEELEKSYIGWIIAGAAAATLGLSAAGVWIFILRKKRV